MKISVIMPVNNSGEYYKEAMESLFAQTFREFEIICVDDCSEDIYTKTLLNQYSINETDIPVSIIRLQEKSGAAEARNIGFRYAKGEYVIFLDSDDIFSTDFLKKMYEASIKINADVCVCAYTSFYCVNNNKINTNFWRLSMKRILDKTQDDWLLSFPMPAWSKLCRKDFLDKNHILFQNISSCNDVYFSSSVMHKATKIAVIDNNKLIFYRTQINNQISSRRNSVNVYKAVMKLLTDNTNDDLFIRQCLGLLLSALPMEIRRCKDEKSNILFYNTVKSYFIENEVTFNSIFYQKYKEQIITYPYEKQCFLKWNTFEGHLEMFSTELKSHISNKRIVLWGNGKRGRAFQEFCIKYRIALEGVVDKLNKNWGEKTEKGFIILGTEDVVNKEEYMIIASNHLIYEDLCSMNLLNEMLDLEMYC